MRQHPIPLGLLAEHYLTTCQVEGKTSNTVTVHREELRPLARWLDGNLGTSLWTVCVAISVICRAHANGRFTLPTARAESRYPITLA